MSRQLLLAVFIMAILTTFIGNVSSWNCACEGSSARHSRQMESQKVNANKSQLTFQNSLCHWGIRIDHDANRVPSEIVYAELISDHCQYPKGTKHINRKTTECVPVEVSLNVTLNCENSTCRTCLESYPVAYICSCKQQSARNHRRRKRKGQRRTNDDAGIDPCN
nr:interleukin 17-11 [Sepiella japonica]